MSGRPSASQVEAMKLVKAGVTPYTAAKRMGVGLGTMYRSRLYKLWKEGSPESLAQLRDELNLAPAKPRVAKKPQKFAQNRASVKS